MDVSELKRKIARGEGFHIEFKDDRVDNRELAKEIVAFANTDGGHLIIGVTDEGSIKGVDEVDGTMCRVDDVALNRCEPPVTVGQETIEMDGHVLLAVHIPKGAQRPYRTKSGQFYVRSANRCRQTSWEELRRLFQESGSIFYDEMPVQTAELTDLDFSYFHEFVTEFLDPDISEEELKPLLNNFHLADSVGDIFKPTLTGLLFFGKKPQFFLPAANIVCAFIRGDDISIPPSDKKELNGTMFRMLEQAQDFMRLYLIQEHRIKGFEPEMKEEIPEFVLREALVNAVAHRDYTINAPVRIIIYEDRLEIRTPGKLPNTVTIESMKTGGSHVLRNPTVYNILLKMRMVTNMGSGVKRIVRTVKEHTGNDVLLEAAQSEFILTIPRR